MYNKKFCLHVSYETTILEEFLWLNWMLFFFYHRLATVPNIIEELLRTENFKKRELGLKHASLLE